MLSTLFKMALVNVFVMSNQAYAESSGNIISCPSRSAGFLFACSVPGGLQLKAKQAIESDFFVSYTMTCNRGNGDARPSQLHLQLENGQEVNLLYNSQTNRVRVGTGFGPVSITDKLPAELSSRKFSDCSLVINDISAEPTSSKKTEWSERQKSLVAQMHLANEAKSAYEALASFAPAFDVYNEFINQLTSDQSTDRELLSSLGSLKSCVNNEDDPITCESFLERILDAGSQPAEGGVSLLTDEEIDRLSGLKRILDRLNVEDAACNDSKGCAKALLEKYLSEDSIAQIVLVRSKLSAIEAAQAKYQEYASRVRTLQEEVEVLKAESKAWLVW